MNELITVNFDTQTVSARELHKALGIEKRFSAWFETNSHGFVEGKDFTGVLVSTEVQNNGGVQMRELQDFNLSVDMAKHICLMSRTDKGKQCRQYLIELEKAWNTPEVVMARALKLANAKIDVLNTTVKVQEQQIMELQPKASYYDVVLNCKDLLSVTEIAKDFGKTANWLNNFLKEHKIQFKQGEIWFLYKKYAEKGYTSTKTHTINGTDGKPHSKVHTYWTQKGRLFIYGLLKSNGVLPIIEQEQTA